MCVDEKCGSIFNRQVSCPIRDRSLPRPYFVTSEIGACLAHHSRTVLKHFFRRDRTVE
jgi:hypothetical protein